MPHAIASLSHTNIREHATEQQFIWTAKLVLIGNKGKR